MTLIVKRIPLSDYHFNMVSDVGECWDCGQTKPINQCCEDHVLPGCFDCCAKRHRDD
jgi:hypothetical protein